MARGTIGRPRPPMEPLKPFKGRDDFYNNILYGDYWKLKPDTNALDTFMKYYNNALGFMGNNNPGGAGLGQYNSDLLNMLSGKVSNMLAQPGRGLDPEIEAMYYGKATDRMAGSQRQALENLADQLAGYGRASGPGMALRQKLLADVQRARSDVARDIAINQAKMAAEAEQNAIKNAMGLESMRGGFFENAQRRALENAALGLKWGAMFPGMLGGLADMLKWNAAQNLEAQKGTLGNLLNLDQYVNSRERQRYDDMNRYLREKYNYDWAKRNFPGMWSGKMQNPWGGGGYPSFSIGTGKGVY